MHVGYSPIRRIKKGASSQGAEKSHQKHKLYLHKRPSDTFAGKKERENPEGRKEAERRSNLL